MIEIPKDVHEGTNAFKYELPWLVSESISFLDEILTKDMKVLEFGSGGSTLFFSKRVNWVLSYESNLEWFDVVSETLKRKEFLNVDLQFYTPSTFPPLSGNFNCVLLDPGGFAGVDPREALLEKTLPLLIHPKILILDNYDEYSWNALDKDLFAMQYKESYVEKTFDHPEWYVGKGTKIFTVNNFVKET